MLLLASGVYMYLIIFLTLALAPAVALMAYVYHLDPIDKEPGRLLGMLILMGVIAGLVSGLLEQLGMNLLGLFSNLDPNSVEYTITTDFLVVGVVEEGMKYALMAKVTWSNKAFNCRFDGVVYAVFTSLGFAAMENIMYGMSYGTDVLFSRAIMAIPAHMGFAVLFGLFYGEAKLLSVKGNSAGCGACIGIGYVLSVSLHGLYDSAAMIQTDSSFAIFVCVVLLLYIICFVVVHIAASHDVQFAA